MYVLNINYIHVFNMQICTNLKDFSKNQLLHSMKKNDLRGQHGALVGPEEYENDAARDKEKSPKEIQFRIF